MVYTRAGHVADSRLFFLDLDSQIFFKTGSGAGFEYFKQKFDQ